EQLERGDVIVFEDHQGWLPPSETDPNPLLQALEFVGLYPSTSEQHLVKRIIGMPGDHVTVDPESRQLVVNGEAIDEPYLAPGSTASDIDFEVTVPEGQLWMMGDHRGASGDSRAHMDGPNDGFVNIDHVVGRAEVVAWPLDRWGSSGSDGEPFEEVPEPYCKHLVFVLYRSLHCPAVGLLLPAWTKSAGAHWPGLLPWALPPLISQWLCL